MNEKKEMYGWKEGNVWMKRRKCMDEKKEMYEWKVQNFNSTLSNILLVYGN